MAIQRKIIHIDMDAFFAQVEQRDHPHLRGHPLVVGGSPQGRGVVAAASYEARAFGIRSAMPMAQAVRRCPQLHIQPPDFARYQGVSRQLLEIFHAYSELVEPLSLDEAYIDVTTNSLGETSATRVAEAIRAQVREQLQLTCSAGVAPVKFVAKIASDVNKPNGICVVPPQRVLDFLAPLPVSRIPGIGPRSTERLSAIGITTIADLRTADETALTAALGRAAISIRERSLGIDERPVVVARPRKSVGVEDTFAQDVSSLPALESELQRLVSLLCERRSRAGVVARTLTLKVRYDDFTTVTRSHSQQSALANAPEILALACDLLRRSAAGSRPVRLLGLSLHNLLPPAAVTQQLSLSWDD